MNKKVSILLAALVCMLGWGCFSFPAMAATMEEEQNDAVRRDGYITISVDAQDDNGELMYAIDSDEPEAFGLSNIFVIDPNIPHTIYVKDIAGNITSQSFQPIGLEVSDNSEALEGTQSGDFSNESPYTDYADAETAEDGIGTIYDKAITDGTDDFSRVFYTVTTKEGEVFYLVIDQNRGQDNVYLLNMVTVDELQALAAENGYVMSEKRSEISNNPDVPPAEETIDDLMEPTQNSKKKSAKPNTKSTIVILVVAVVGCGAYYYLKVHKKKKDAAMDEIDQALDMDEFVSNDQDERDEIEMPVDDQTISDDEFYSVYDEEESAYLDMDPDEEEE